jgi:gluconolactonase
MPEAVGDPSKHEKVFLIFGHICCSLTNVSSYSMKKLLSIFVLAGNIMLAQAPNPADGKIISYDPSFARLVPAEAKIEVLAKDFVWTEGPVWVKNGGYLLFSDPRQNKIFRWDQKDGLTEFMKDSGYTGKEFYSAEPGSNGLLINEKGELVACEQGDRRISKMPLAGGKKVTLADKFNGEPFNSPNDIWESADGTYYFTDPPYGFQGRKDDPTETTKIFGVYRIGKNGVVTRIISDLKRPNGITLSLDGKTLYVSQTDHNAFIMSYPVNQDGSVGEGKIFIDLRPLKTAADGLKLDHNGNFFTGAGNGITVFSPEGKLLGKIETGVQTANCAFGADGWLYITAGKYLCRVKTTTSGR